MATIPGENLLRAHLALEPKFSGATAALRDLENVSLNFQPVSNRNTEPSVQGREREGGRERERERERETMQKYSTDGSTHKQRDT